jgi:hypothetical protein
VWQDAGAHLPADALEIEVKDSWGTHAPARSFNSRGSEMTIGSYGLVPGKQNDIWVIFVDDSAARDQRAASAALTDLAGTAQAILCSCMLFLNALLAHLQNLVFATV